MLLVNTHAHSTLSDGREPPERMIGEYKRRGYDAVVMTDHRNEKKPYSYPDVEGIIVIGGCEVSSGEHFVYARAGEEELRIKCHPGRYRDPISEVEKWNLYECSEHAELEPKYLRCRGNYPIISDDAHSLHDIGRAGILVDAKRKGEAILRAVRRGDFRWFARDLGYSLKTPHPKF